MNTVFSSPSKAVVLAALGLTVFLSGPAAYAAAEDRRDPIWRTFYIRETQTCHMQAWAHDDRSKLLTSFWWSLAPPKEHDKTATLAFTVQTGTGSLDEVASVIILWARDTASIEARARRDFPPTIVGADAEAIQRALSRGDPVVMIVSDAQKRARRYPVSSMDFQIASAMFTACIAALSRD